MQFFCPTKDVVEIMHVALTLSWSCGPPWLPYQLDRVRVKAISPKGHPKSQASMNWVLVSNQRLAPPFHLEYGNSHYNVICEHVRNRLCDDGVVWFGKRPNPSSSTRITTSECIDPRTLAIPIRFCAFPCGYLEVEKKRSETHWELYTRSGHGVYVAQLYYPSSLEVEIKV